MTILGNTGKNTWLEVSIHEGKNRQIHRTAEALGFNVLKLTRVGYGGLALDDLRVGTTRELTHDEVDKLRRAAGGSKHTFEKVRKRAPGKSRRRTAQPPRRQPQPTLAAAADALDAMASL